MIDFDKHVLAPIMSAFGEPVTYLPASRAAFDVIAVFDDRFRETTYRDGLEVIDIRPVLGARTSSFPNGLPQPGETFLVRGRSYSVAMPAEADGHGHVKVRLRFLSDADASAFSGRSTP